MQMTYERYPAAFRTAEERSDFFRAAEAGRPVPPGTAMKHVIASNSAIWLNEGALMVDVVRILKHELDTWADREGEERLVLPVETFVHCHAFRKAFGACLAVGRHDIDDVITRERILKNPGMNIDPPPQRVRAEDDPRISHLVWEKLLADIYRELCCMEDNVRRAVSDRERGEAAFRERMMRVGLDPDNLPDLDAPLSPRAP